MDEHILKSFSRKILESPFELDWSIQGLGMLRLYLNESTRLHIWDDRYKVESVSEMHTHPWDFKSTIIVGHLANTIFIEDTKSESVYNKQKIFCGVGGGLVEEPSQVNLRLWKVEFYEERESYVETANEIHVSNPSRGTVTLVRRHFLEDKDHAYVYWDSGDWVSAEPRKATHDEIADICENSLKTWF